MKKIVTIGPESTGKSSLCEQLAQHYNTVWCPEYAREYLLEHGMNYGYDDLLIIAKGQVALEEECQSAVGSRQWAVGSRQSAVGSGQSAAGSKHPSPITHHSLLFVDTNMYVMKVWCEFVFGKCHQWILDQIEQRKYDLYLLCDIDLPWVQDELREYPDIERRQELFAIYRSLMQNQSTPWIIINGNADERFAKASAAVDHLLNNNLDYFRGQ